MKKPFKVAAYSFIIFIASGIIFGLLFDSSTSFVPIFSNSIISIPMNIIFNLISFSLIILITYGFILLGKKLKSKYLVVVSWIGIFLNLIFYLYLLFGNLIFNVPSVSEEKEFLIFILLVHLVFSIVFGIHSIFFGAALLKIKDKIKYAKSAGILNIITGSTFIIGVGYIVLIATNVMEILMLFEASRMFEDRKTNRFKNKRRDN